MKLRDLVLQGCELDRVDQQERILAARDSGGISKHLRHLNNLASFRKKKSYGQEIRDSEAEKKLIC